MSGVRIANTGDKILRFADYGLLDTSHIILRQIGTALTGKDGEAGDDRKRLAVFLGIERFETI